MLRLGIALAVLLQGVCLAAGGIEPGEYRQRREALKRATGDAVTILFGRTEKQGGDLRNGFFQEANFYYLTGWTEPGAILVMTPRADVLLAPRRDGDREKWTGRTTGPDEEAAVKNRTAVDEVAAAETFEQKLNDWLALSPRLYTLAGEAGEEILKRLAPRREIQDVRLPIARLRMLKSPAERTLIERAMEATLAAHRAAWKKARPGVTEYQLAAAIGATYFEQGCERHAYAPIVGSGPNSTVLHYTRNSRRADRGEVIVIDAGAECSMYAADITRTIPVGGKFTPRQREIYDLVLGAQDAAIAAMKPGMTMGKNTPNSVYKVVMEYFEQRGVARYFTHGLGHPVGLDVHDAQDPAMPLADGMVVTVEPGLYLPEENIGVRIEDMVLITADGAKILSGRLPRTADEVERAVGR